MFVSELKKDFTVRKVPMTATKIDDDIKVLVVVHPRNISDATQYAIDQFLCAAASCWRSWIRTPTSMKATISRTRTFKVVGDNAYGQSSLDNLLKAWGLSMDLDKVVADTSFGSRNQQNRRHDAHLADRHAGGIDQNDVVTSQIDNLLFPLPALLPASPPRASRKPCWSNHRPIRSWWTPSSPPPGASKFSADFKAENWNIRWPFT